MVADSDERIGRINDLDMKHQNNIHQIDLVNKDEEARRLKLRVLALRDDNATLKDQVMQRDARLKSLQRQGSDVRVELDEAKETAKLQESRLQKQTKELTDLKTELGSLNGSMQDSSKTLQEKFALTRELNKLRPEIEHLQSQLANHQTVVAEKLDLQRQVNSLEVELDNEKRSRQKQRKQRLADEDGEEWKSRFEEAEKTHTSEKKLWETAKKEHASERKEWEKAKKEHASERKEWEKAKKEHDRELREAQGETERLEERISTMKSKLKNTQTELKEAQAELETCRAELAAVPKASKATGAKSKKKVTVKEQPAKKRRANEMSLDDITIGTPGHDDTTFKRPIRKRAEHTLVGEKSTFSITPFLNRTKNLADDSLEEASPTGKMAEAPEPIFEEEEDESLPPVSEMPVQEAPVEPAVAVAVAEAKKPAPKTQKPRGRKPKALGDAPTSKKNMSAPSAEKTETIHFTTKLDMVTEESQISEQENAPVHKLKKGLELKPKMFEFRGAAANASILDADGKKKKRKLLGGASKTLFDDEDGEVAKKPAKIALAPTRKLKAHLGGASNAFAGATFSPLKRHRRGVNASFLA
ncbi:Fc.00g100200.m01.CDS01 [Cosmosporella sp. VM-42]